LSCHVFLISIVQKVEYYLRPCYYVCSENERRIPTDAEVRLIFGIVGVIRLLAGNSYFESFSPAAVVPYTAVGWLCVRVSR